MMYTFIYVIQMLHKTGGEASENLIYNKLSYT